MYSIFYILYSTKVVGLTSVIKTDHSAIVATTKGGVKDRNKSTIKKTFRRKSPNQHASLLSELKDFDDSTIRNILDLQEAWDAFYLQMSSWLDSFYPLRTVSITN